MEMVYALIDPRTRAIRYVGVTGDTLRRRLQRHMALARRGDRTHRSCWIRQLIALGTSPEIVLVEQIERQMRSARERHWIQQFVLTGADLTNRTNGGESLPPSPRPPQRPETKEKIRRALTGKTHSAERRAAIAAGLTGKRPNRIYRPMTAEMKAKLVASNKGSKRPCTEERARAISAAKKGKPIKSSGPMSAQARANMSAAQRAFPVHAKLSHDDVREIRRLYAAGGLRQKDLAERYGLTRSSIACLLQGRTWAYVT